jgi:hypothetical protein
MSSCLLKNVFSNFCIVFLLGCSGSETSAPVKQGGAVTSQSGNVEVSPVGLAQAIQKSDLPSPIPLTPEQLGEIVEKGLLASPQLADTLWDSLPQGIASDLKKEFIESPRAFKAKYEKILGKLTGEWQVGDKIWNGSSWIVEKTSSAGSATAGLVMAHPLIAVSIVAIGIGGVVAYKTGAFSSIANWWTDYKFPMNKYTPFSTAYLSQKMISEKDPATFLEVARNKLPDLFNVVESRQLGEHFANKFEENLKKVKVSVDPKVLSYLINQKNFNGKEDGKKTKIGFVLRDEQGDSSTSSTTTVDISEPINKFFKDQLTSKSSVFLSTEEAKAQAFLSVVANDVLAEWEVPGWVWGTNSKLSESSIADLFRFYNSWRLYSHDDEIKKNLDDINKVLMQVATDTLQVDPSVIINITKVDAETNKKVTFPVPLRELINSIVSQKALDAVFVPPVTLSLGMDSFSTRTMRQSQGIIDLQKLSLNGLKSVKLLTSLPLNIRIDGDIHNLCTDRATAILSARLSDLTLGFAYSFSNRGEGFNEKSSKAQKCSVTVGRSVGAFFTEMRADLGHAHKINNTSWSEVNQSWKTGFDLAWVSPFVELQHRFFIDQSISSHKRFFVGMDFGSVDCIVDNNSLSSGLVVKVGRTSQNKVVGILNLLTQVELSEGFTLRSEVDLSESCKEVSFIFSLAR